MESPARSIRFVHKAIQTEIDALDREVERLAAGDRDDAAEMARRFDFFYQVVKAHEDGEEDTFFPAVDERVYPVSAPYLLDHQADQGHIRELSQSLGLLAGNPDGRTRSEILRRAKRLTTILDGATAIHIQKEEAILLPLIEQNFSFAEQEDLTKRAVAHVPPEVMQQMFPWLVGSLATDDQEAFLRDMMQLVPPNVFHMMSGLLATNLPPDQWAEIVRRLPEAA
ncbi:MAG: hemerythrin domain-containing protein [Dehalococcoidia bacterium]|jgi:hemerythrin-like domain-containing protein